MLTNWQQQAIDNIIEKLKVFYEDSTKGLFSFENKIEEFTKEEKAYFNSKFNLSELVNADKSIFVQ